MKIKYVAALMGITLVAGCSSKKEENKVEPVAVKTISVKAGGEGGTRTYVGTIQESYGSTLSFASLGTVSSVFVKDSF